WGHCDAGQFLAPPYVGASAPRAAPSPGHARTGFASRLPRSDPCRRPFFVLLRRCPSGVRGMGRDLCGCPPAGQCGRGRLSDRRVLARVYRGPLVRHSPGDALGPTPDGPGGLVAVSRPPCPAAPPPRHARGRVERDGRVGLRPGSALADGLYLGGPVPPADGHGEWVDLT